MAIIIATNGGSKETDTGVKSDDTEKNVVTEEIAVTEETVYENVDLQTMFDDLDANAMKSENTYKNKYVEFSCKIANFDSSGKYIGVEPVNASELNFITATCYIKNDTQKSFLIEKNVGDIVTIKGKVKSIGEVLGYSFDIKEVY